MNRKLKAIFRDGAFVPQEPCNFPEESEVDLFIQGPTVIPPKVTEPEEVELLLKRLNHWMRLNPFPEGISALTRDELHERR